MKSQDEILDKLIDIDSELLNNGEAIRTFSSCFGREKTEQESRAMNIRTLVLEAQKDVLTWVLENK